MDLAQNREHKFVSAVMYLHNDAAYIDMFLSMITQELAALLFLSMTRLRTTESRKSMISSSTRRWIPRW